MKALRNLFFLLLFVTLSCQEFVVPDVKLPSGNLEYITAQQVPGLIAAIAPYVNPSLSGRGDIASANQNESYFGMLIDFDHIIARLDEKAEHTDFVMRLDDQDKNPFTFRNLVITQDELGQFYQPFLMTYEMTEEFGYQYFQTGSLEGFSGTIKRGYLAPIQASAGRLGKTLDSEETDDPNDYGSERDDPVVVCEKVQVLSGGETTSSSPTGGAYEVCEVFEYTYYEYKEDGTKVKWYSVISYENCYWDYPDQSSSDAADCPEDNSEVPVNEPEPEDPEGTRPIDEYESKCEGIKELWENYPDNEVGGYITEEGKLIFTHIGTLDNVQLVTPWEFKGHSYYVYPDNEGAPVINHEGLKHFNGNYHIPIVASFHTHPKCAKRGTSSGVESVSGPDKEYAAKATSINNWVIGCDAIGKFKGGLFDFLETYSGSLDDLCDKVK